MLELFLCGIKTEVLLGTSLGTPWELDGDTVGTHWNRPKKKKKKEKKFPTRPLKTQKKKTKAPLIKPSQWLHEISILKTVVVHHHF
jgi:hypothetical protein